MKKKIEFNFNNKKYLLSEFNQKLITKKYISWLNNKNLMKYSQHNDVVYNKKKCTEFMKKIKKENNIFFAIFSMDGKKIHIGNIIIYFHRKNNSVGLSIMIGEQKYKKIGLASFIWGLIIKYVFNNYRVRIIISGCLSINKSMIKIFKKNKMKISYLPERFQFRKKPVDGVYAYIKRKI